MSGSNNTLKQLGSLLISIGILGLFWWSQKQPDTLEATPKASTGDRTECRILTVYDGDNIGCDLNGDGKIQKPQEQIRLLGIDTPEMHYSKKNKRRNNNSNQDEPWAIEASRYTKQLDKKTVYLEFDREQHDKYGRTLAYVYESKQTQESVSEKLLKQGFATILIIRPNTRDEDILNTAETQARKEHLGIWAQ